MATVRVPMVEQMHDDAVCSHLEKRHKNSLAGLEFKPEPQRKGQPRRLMDRIAWETYHELLHRSGKHNHTHVRVNTDG